MKRNVIILALLLVSSTLTIGLLFYPRAKATDKMVTANPKIIWVPDNYTKIQWAIGNASSRDTIKVRAGLYYENVVVDKSVSLVGENVNNTIIDGNGAGTVIHIIIDNVEIKGFTIRNSGSQKYGIWSGEATSPVKAEWRADNAHIIMNNVITNNSWGIFIEWGNDHIIVDNTVLNNEYEGIHVKWSQGNIVTGNIVSNCQDGINLKSANDNFVANNTVFSNSNNGIHVSGLGNIITDNVVSDNLYGFCNTNTNTLSNNTATLNIEAGIYAGATSGARIIGNNVSNNIGSGIKALDSDDNIFSGNTISNNGQDGIEIDGENSVISGNTISDNNEDGIHVSGPYNQILGNAISHNAYDGIWLWDFDYGVLSDNIVSNNEGNGIYLGHSSFSLISGNTVSFNKGAGIAVFFSLKNLIFQNEFSNNAKQVNIVSSTNSWDNNTIGNYWSDYDEKDVDKNGIGDTPHTIDQYNRDNYPLMGKFSDFSISWEYETYHVTTICNSTISAFQFDGANRIIGFNVTGPDDTAGFCRITIPMDLLKPNATYSWKVFIDDIEINYAKIENGNYTLIYFTYTHSTHKVQITVKKIPAPFWIQWWFWSIIIGATAILVTTMFLIRRGK